MKRMLVIPLALGALAACGGTSTGGAGTTSGSTVNTGTPALGTVLTDSQGRTLYFLSTEQGGKDKCTSQQGCAAAWPLLVAPSSGSPTAASGVTGTLGVITAGDGTMEVTYNGWPLHTFNNEPAGQTGGQGIMSFGGVWYAATPALTSTGAGGSGAGSSGAASSGASPSSPYGY
jgi:predicted lipoprotein with Yx(FWY)xxD motif